MDAARDGAGDRIGGYHAEFGEAEQRIDRSFAGRRCEYHVAVERRMHGVDGAGHAGLRDHGQPSRLRLGQHGVGDHDHQCGVFRRACFRAALEPHSQHARREGGGQATPPELVAGLERRRPEPWPIADRHAANGVDHRQCRDLDAVFGLSGRGAETALETGRGGAAAGADAAQRKIGACGASGGIAEIAIGRETPPGLVAAIEQVEADRARNDRNQGLADPQAAALFGEPGLQSPGAVQPERGAARQGDAVDGFDRAFKTEQGFLANAGSAAAHIDRSDRGRIENDGGDAGGEGGVVGMTDADTGDIGEEVFQEVCPSGHIKSGLFSLRIYQP